MGSSASPSASRTGEPGRALLAWALGAFHAALLVAALVLLAHATIDFGPVLALAGTAPGLGLYAALWASTAWTTRRAIGGFDAAATFDAPAARRLLRGGLAWGTVNGAIFVAVLVAAIAVRDASVALLLAGAITAAFAAGAGALVGAAFATLDLALFAAARALAREGSSRTEE